MNWISVLVHGIEGGLAAGVAVLVAKRWRVTHAHAEIVGSVVGLSVLLFLNFAVTPAVHRFLYQRRLDSFSVVAALKAKDPVLYAEALASLKPNDQEGGFPMPRESDAALESVYRRVVEKYAEFAPDDEVVALLTFQNQTLGWLAEHAPELCKAFGDGHLSASDVGRIPESLQKLHIAALATLVAKSDPQRTPPVTDGDRLLEQRVFPKLEALYDDATSKQITAGAADPATICAFYRDIYLTVFGLSTPEAAAVGRAMLRGAAATESSRK